VANKREKREVLREKQGGKSFKECIKRGNIFMILAASRCKGT